eukprot:gb/GECG01002028.1/.p1 GENE.gb/GECG01002028.1/~~gb/GECG01002028.1/.p1  ORF type:complete len:409 (+),score=23.02 gb/GECG01002028.1/:1-1227(+)
MGDATHGLTPISYVGIFTCMVAFTAGHTLLAQSSKVNGEFRYSYISVSFMGEVLKLVICGGILLKQKYLDRGHSINESPSVGETYNGEGTAPIREEINDEEEAVPLTSSTSSVSLRRSRENRDNSVEARTSACDANASVLERLQAWFKRSWIFAIPSVLYMVDNNLMYVILIFIAPATQQLLWNVKIIWTAVLFRFFLKRILTRLQWGALLLLLVGVITTQSSKFLHEDGKQEVMTAETHDLLVGASLVLIGSFFSSLAAVYTEYVLKSQSTGNDFWERNINMYIYGALFNACALLIKDGTNVFQRGMFYEYNIFTVMLVLDTAFNGLSTAGIYRYLDNITGVLAHVTAMLAVIAVSVWLFDFTINIVVTCGFCACVIGIWLYHHEPLQDPSYIEKIKTTHKHLKEQI